jgi:hypothetical protein
MNNCLYTFIFQADLSPKLPIIQQYLIVGSFMKLRKKMESHCSLLMRYINVITVSDSLLHRQVAMHYNSSIWEVTGYRLNDRIDLRQSQGLFSFSACPDSISDSPNFLPIDYWGLIPLRVKFLDWEADLLPANV